MDYKTPVSKTLSATVKSVSDTGAFEAYLSTPDLDLEGDVLSPDGWELPLPARIPVNIDHKIGVLTTVGSAVPSLDERGMLKVDGTFASTPAGQEVRTLVREGHITTMSVEFLQYWEDDEDGGMRPGMRTLTGGAFTPIPANPKAVVLSAKSTMTVDDIASRLDELAALVKSLANPIDECKSTESVDNDPQTETDPVADSADDAAADPAAAKAADSRDLKSRAMALQLFAVANLSE